jgi:hypothetical protein
MTEGRLLDMRKFPNTRLWNGLLVSRATTEQVRVVTAADLRMLGFGRSKIVRHEIGIRTRTCQQRQARVDSAHLKLVMFSAKLSD